MVKELKIGPITIFFGRLPYYPYCNTYRVQGQKTLLVDPACEEKTLRHLRANGTVDFLFNTHYHPDHIRYNRLFPEAQCFIHAEDAPCLRSVDSMAEYVGVQGTAYEKGWRKNLLETFGFQERDGITEIQDGGALDLGGVTIRFIHLPGHTPGHCGFLVPKWKVFFIGDMELSPAGPWYSNRRASIEEIIQSIEKIRRIPADHYVPSHGNVVSAKDIGERLDRYLQNIYRREEKILNAVATPKTLDEITALSLISGFRLAPQVIWYYFEKTMVGKHLERLLRQGKVAQVQGKWIQTA